MSSFKWACRVITWFERFTKAAEVINTLQVEKFPLLLGRILSKLHIKVLLDFQTIYNNYHLRKNDMAAGRQTLYSWRGIATQDVVWIKWRRLKTGAWWYLLYFWTGVQNIYVVLFPLSDCFSSRHFKESRPSHYTKCFFKLDSTVHMQKYNVF